MDKSKFALMVFLHYSKAFDSIKHDGDDCSTGLLAWFSSCCSEILFTGCPSGGSVIVYALHRLFIFVPILACFEYYTADDTSVSYLRFDCKNI